jgi:hypothetical protein
VVEDVPDVHEALLEAREAHGDAVHRPRCLLARAQSAAATLTSRCRSARRRFISSVQMEATAPIDRPPPSKEPTRAVTGRGDGLAPKCYGILIGS